MDATKLTSFGSSFLELVGSKWPEFLDHASLSKRGCLVIEYPSPHRPDRAVLRISADDDYDEVIIGFAGGHSHGGPWSDPDDGDYHFKSSMSFIRAILGEEVVGCVLNSGGAIGYLDHLKDAPYWSKVREVKSWKGTHDATY
jgi:hypothetical protein